MSLIHLLLSFGNELQAAGNVILSIATLIYAILLFYYSQNNIIDQTTKWFLRGTGIASLMLSAHSAYVAVFWIARILGETDIADSLIENSVFSMIPLTIATFGINLSLVPMFIKNKEFSWRPYFYVSIGMVAAWWLLLLKFIQM